MPKAAFFTQGCKINIVDTEVLKESLTKEGYEIISDFNTADLIVINSCTVTEKADAKFKAFIAKIKKSNPQAVVAAVGCYTELNGAALKNDLGIDIILGSGNKFELVDRLKELRDDQCVSQSSSDNAIFFDYNINNFSEHSRAFLKIQDGCDHFCTYCTIPKARGKSRSRRSESIMRDVKNLVANGYQEIVISGIDLGDYKDNGLDLYGIIEEMLKIDGFRLRISSLEPWSFEGRLLDLVLNEPRICPHFHLPLQAASDVVLKKMNRGYRLQDFDAIVQKLAQRKNAMLAADIIVGFPQESDEDFAQTLNYLQNSALSYAHVFSYSDRPHAAARNLFPKVAPEVIKERSRILREASDLKKQDFYRSCLGQTFDMLVETVRDGYYEGYAENYLPLKLKTDNLFQKREIVKVETTNLLDDQLESKLSLFKG